METYKGYKSYFRYVNDKEALEEEDREYLSTSNKLEIED